MANYEELVRVSIGFNGQYLNGGGSTVTYTHEAINPHHPHDLALQLELVAGAMEKADKTDEAQTRNGFRVVEHVGLTQLEELELDTNFVAKVAKSQLDPEWVEKTRRLRVKQTARALSASRLVARAFHEVSLEQFNAS